MTARIGVFDRRERAGPDMERHAADRVTRSFGLPVDGPGQVAFDELGMGALAFVPPRVALPALRLAGRASQQSLLRLP